MTSKLRADRAREQDQTTAVRSVALSRLALEALAGAKRIDLDRADGQLAAAIRFYLDDRDSDQAAWPYPGFLRESESQGDLIVRLDLDDDLWASFEGEAETQGVSTQQLAEHAAFYFAAEADAGRVTQRILDELGGRDVNEG